MKERFTGTLRRSAFSGGWTLETGDGEILSLDGYLDASIEEGEHVEVIGTISDDMVSIDMTGPVVKVFSLTRG